MNRGAVGVDVDRGRAGIGLDNALLAFEHLDVLEERVVDTLLQKVVDVTLPQASNTVEKRDNDEQTVLALTADGRFYVDQVLTTENELLSSIQNALDRKFERILLIKADEDARYSAVMQILDQLQRAGIEDIGLVTERRLGSAGGGG